MALGSFRHAPFFCSRLLLFLLAISLATADDEWRTWTSSTGSTLEARVVKLSGSSVTLKRKDSGKSLTLELGQLSKEDQEHLGELLRKADEGEKGETTVSGIEAKPGKISGVIKCADKPWSYHLYLPKNFHTGRKWPVLFLFAAGGAGKDGFEIKRYIEGAERIGCIVAASVESRNGFDDSEFAMEAMANDVFERLPVSQDLGFSSGMSGGSRMAHLLAERDKRIFGILACASGGGVYQKGQKFRHAKLRKSTYVYSLMGTNCFNRGEAVRSHLNYPKECRLRFFPGDHWWAEPPLIAEGMVRVYGEILSKNKGRDLDPHRRLFAGMMGGYIDGLQKANPSEALYLAEFMTKFPGTPESLAHAKKVVSTLEGDLGTEAEKDILKFARKHYKEFNAGQSADASREAEARKLADKYPGLPHAEILTKLGKLSPK